MKFRHKSLMGLIYCCLVALPFVSVISRVIYVQSNKNAYESYSGLNQNTETIVNISTVDDFDYSKNYYLGNSYVSQNDPNSSSGYMYFDSVEVVRNNTSTTNEIIEQFDRLYIYSTSSTLFYNFYYGTTNVTLNSGNDFLLKVKIRSFNGNTTQIATLNNDLQYSNMLYYIEYYNAQQLDNVFEYSLDKTIEGNNLGRIPFFDFLFNLCFDSNTVNNRYVGFVNWYLNYAMLISLAYILFLVLMWFVNFARRLLERGMNYDW